MNLKTIVLNKIRQTQKLVYYTNPLMRNNNQKWLPLGVETDWKGVSREFMRVMAMYFILIT